MNKIWNNWTRVLSFLKELSIHHASFISKRTDLQKRRSRLIAHKHQQRRQTRPHAGASMNSVAYYFRGSFRVQICSGHSSSPAKKRRNLRIIWESLSRRRFYGFTTGMIGIRRLGQPTRLSLRGVNKWCIGVIYFMLIETNNFRVIYIRKVCCFVRTDTWTT